MNHIRILSPALDRWHYCLYDLIWRYCAVVIGRFAKVNQGEKRTMTTLLLVQVCDVIVLVDIHSKCKITFPCWNIRMDKQNTNKSSRLEGHWIVNERQWKTEKDFYPEKGKSVSRSAGLGTVKLTVTYLLAPWITIRVEKLTGSQLVKKFPTFCGTRRLVTTFTNAHHLSLFRAWFIQSMPPHRTSWRSILILTYHLRMGLPNYLFPSVFPTKILYTPLFPPFVLHAPIILFFSISSPE